MRYSRLQRKIALIVPIRDERVFLRKTEKLLDQSLETWESIRRGVTQQTQKDRSEFDLESALDGSAQPKATYTLLRDPEIDRIKSNAKWLHDIAKQKYDSWLIHYVNQLKQILSKLDPYQAVASKLDLKVFRERVDYDFPWDAEYQEGIRPEIVEMVASLKRIILNLHKQLSIQAARAEATITQDVKPGAVETLYHASANAVEIHAKGFSKDVPDEAKTMGLGGSQVDKAGNKAISFTYDLGSALQIARAYKELAMVYTGEVKARMILKWVESHGNPKKFLAFLDMDWRSYRYIVRFERGWVLYEPDVVTRQSRPVSADEIWPSARDRVNLYKAYLSTSKRFNPFFMHMYGTARHLAKKPKSIGVLSAEVDMTHPHIGYHSGEREFRVPPAAVIKIRKLIK